MKALRLLYRVPGVGVVTLASYMTVLSLRLLRPLAPKLQLRWRNRVFRLWGAATGRLLGMRVRTVGQPPTGSFFLVSNHLGYADILLIGAHAPAAFVAKADLSRWPLAGRIIAAGDTIFIDRGRKKDLLRVMGLIDQAQEQGLGVLLFPEGTSGSGEEILPFKPSLLQYPANRACPVHYATVSYRLLDDDGATRDVVCWWRDGDPFGPHFLRLAAQRGFEATLCFGEEPITSTDRKTLAERLRSAMTETFEPISSPLEIQADKAEPQESEPSKTEPAKSPPVASPPGADRSGAGESKAVEGA